MKRNHEKNLTTNHTNGRETANVHEKDTNRIRISSIILCIRGHSCLNSLSCSCWFAWFVVNHSSPSSPPILYLMS
jgi:hypothetical protein